MDHFKEFLRELTVVYYDDGVTEDGNKYVGGPIWPYDKDYCDSLKSGIDIFRHRVHLYKDVEDVDKMFTPMTWPCGDPEGAYIEAKLKADPLTADMLAWGELNAKFPLDNIKYGQYIKVGPQDKKHTRSIGQQRDTSKYNNPEKGKYSDVG